MYISKILSRYIFKELLGTFLLAVLVFSSVALMARMIELMDLVINKGFAPGQVLLIIVYVMPSLLVYTVPMSVILAVLITLGRLSADSEITALKASGISLYQTMPPFIILCLIGFLLTALCSVSLEPLGKRTLRKNIKNAGMQHAAAALTKDVFNDTVEGLVFYVQDFDQDTLRVKNIMISDRRNPSQPVMIVARNGIILSDQNNQHLLFKLYNGSIHRRNMKQKYEYAIFKTYQMRLPIEDTKEDNKPLKPKELSLKKLLAQMTSLKNQGQKYRREITEVNRRFALPFACPIFALLGLSLGVYLRRGGRASGFTVSLFIVLLHYLLFNLGEELAKGGSMPPVVGMWLPNAVMGSVAVYLFYKTVKEKPFPFSVVYNKKIAPHLSRAAETLIKKITRLKN